MQNFQSLDYVAMNNEDKRICVTNTNFPKTSYIIRLTHPIFMYMNGADCVCAKSRKISRLSKMYFSTRFGFIVLKFSLNFKFKCFSIQERYISHHESRNATELGSAEKDTQTRPMK